MNSINSFKSVKEIRDIETDKLTGYLVDGMTVPLVKDNRHYQQVQKWIQAGNKPEPAYTKEQRDKYLLDKKIQKWKKERQEKVDNIEVTYNNVVYQGDELSQTRIARAITAMGDSDTIDWVAKDNSVHPLTKDDLKAILLKAGQEQSKIWVEGRPE